MYDVDLIVSFYKEVNEREQQILWGKVIKVKNFKVDIPFGHGAIRLKHKL